MPVSERALRTTTMRGAAVAAAAAAAAAAASVAAGQRARPQFLVVNKASFSADPLGWNQDVPESCSDASFQEILAALPRGGDARRLGVGVQLMALDAGGPGVAAAFLAALLNKSVAYDVPVAFAVDAFQFWSARPDLWNWFNASAPGYSAGNVANVEWTGWSPANATMLAWRDWGSQFRVPPHPNLASPAVLAAYADAVRPAAAVVGGWYAALPPAKRYLLAGVKISWEATIGTNFYFYPGGNAYAGQDPKNDPTGGAPASVQQGYAAVCTARGGAGGGGCAGGVTVPDLDAVVRGYLGAMAGVFAGAGVPRTKMYTHVGASFGDAGAHAVWVSAQSAVIPGAAPGYSFYSYAYDAGAAPGLAAALDAVGGGPWAASEWLYMGGNSGTPEEQWAAAINNTLSHRNARLLDVFNWEGVKATPAAVAALSAALSAPPACVVDAPQAVTAAPAPGGGGAVVLTWLPSIDSDADALDVSSVPDTLPSGALADPDVLAGADVTGRTSFTVAPPGPGWANATLWAVVRSRGCGGTQAMASDAVAFVVPAGAAAGAAAGA